MKVAILDYKTGTIYIVDCPDYQTEDEIKEMYHINEDNLFMCNVKDIKFELGN